MYGIFTYIYHKRQPNVGKYTIHGFYGICLVVFWDGRKYMNTMAEAMFWNNDEGSMSTGFSKTALLEDHCEKWNHIPTTPANIGVIKNSGLPDDRLGQTPAS